MRIDRPPPGEELNSVPATVAREAACLILLRDADAGPEVLLVQRNPEQRFMGGAWVFPGGATHDDDADHAATAVRELEEEAGVRLDDGERWWCSRAGSRPARSRSASTPGSSWPRRPPAPSRACDGAECVDARWIRPADALARASATR